MIFFLLCWCRCVYTYSIGLLPLLLPHEWYYLKESQTHANLCGLLLYHPPTTHERSVSKIGYDFHTECARKRRRTHARDANAQLCTHLLLNSHQSIKSFIQFIHPPPPLSAPSSCSPRGTSRWSSNFQRCLPSTSACRGRH